MSRKVKIYSTLGESGVELETAVETWGELQETMNARGMEFNPSTMAALIGQSKVSLEHKQAALPNQDFTLFLMPQRTKSGALDLSSASFQELRHEAKRIMDEEGIDAIDHFNDGRNYTNKGASELRMLLSEWYNRDREEPAFQSPEEFDFTKDLIAEFAKRLRDAGVDLHVDQGVKEQLESLETDYKDNYIEPTIEIMNANGDTGVDNVEDCEKIKLGLDILGRLKSNGGPLSNNPHLNNAIMSLNQVCDEFRVLVEDDLRELKEQAFDIGLGLGYVLDDNNETEEEDDF